MPTLTVIAGPNGSGKSTLTQSFEFEGRDRLLDPDEIARSLNPLNPSAAAIAAGRDVLKRTVDYLNRALSFAVETTLSSHGRVNLIHKAKSRGYRVHLPFIGLDSPGRCIARIRNRAARGGHFIPDADVRRRYVRSVANALKRFDPQMPPDSMTTPETVRASSSQLLQASLCGKPSHFQNGSNCDSGR